jgi:hypothetical protein
LHITTKEELYPYKSLHFEALQGNKRGYFSVKVNDQYRIEFTLGENIEQPILTICNIVDYQTTMTNMITLPNIDPSMIANNLTPFEPTHPGQLLREELEERKLTQAKLAA